MQNIPPINADQYDLEPLLAARGLTMDWLNKDDGDLFGPHNAARYSVLEAAKVVPRLYGSAQPSRPELRVWVDRLATVARDDQTARWGAGVASVHHGPSLLLLGVTGVGKTHEAFGAVRDLALTGVAVKWVATTAADLYAALRPRHGIDSEAEFRRYRSAQVLLVDDLGAERKTSEFTEEVNFRLINFRYEHQLPTLLTSNVLPKELAGRLGDRVTSRLAEMCQRVVIKGQDRRKGGEAA